MRTAIILSLLLGGCAYNVEKTANVTGNEVGVTVNNVWNANQAMPIADKHCHQFGKAARLTGNTSEYAFTYNCVPI